MKTNEFCYWLQGFYELNVNVDEMTTIQLGLLKGHLNLCEKNEGELKGFPLWLKGFLRGLDLSAGEELKTLNRVSVREIEIVLATYFKNVIDHTYEKTAEELRQEHPQRPQVPIFGGPDLKSLLECSQHTKLNC